MASRIKSRASLKGPVPKMIFVVEFGGSQIKLVKFDSANSKVTADVEDVGLDRIVSSEEVPWFPASTSSKLTVDEVAEKVVDTIVAAKPPDMHILVMFFISGGHMLKSYPDLTQDDISDPKAKARILKAGTKLGDAILCIRDRLFKVKIPQLLPSTKKEFTEKLIIHNEGILEGMSTLARYARARRSLGLDEIEMDNTLLLFAGSTSAQFVYHESKANFTVTSIPLKIHPENQEQYKEMIFSNLDTVCGGNIPKLAIYGSNFAFIIRYRVMNIRLNIDSEPFIDIATTDPEYSEDMMKARKLFLEKYNKNTGCENDEAQKVYTDIDDLKSNFKAVFGKKPNSINIISSEEMQELGSLHAQGHPGMRGPEFAIDSIQEWLRVKQVPAMCFFKEVIYGGKAVKVGPAHGASLEALRRHKPSLCTIL